MDWTTVLTSCGLGYLVGSLSFEYVLLHRLDRRCWGRCVHRGLSVFV